VPLFFVRFVFATTVDVRDLERNHLRGPESGTVGEAERSAILQARCDVQQSRHLLRTEHHGQPARLAQFLHFADLLYDNVLLVCIEETN